MDKKTILRILCVTWTEISYPTPIRIGVCHTPLGRWSRKSMTEICQAHFAPKRCHFCSIHLSLWFARSTANTSGTGPCPDWGWTGDPGPCHGAPVCWMFLKYRKWKSFLFLLVTFSLAKTNWSRLIYLKHVYKCIQSLCYKSVPILIRVWSIFVTEFAKTKI